MYFGELDNGVGTDDIAAEIFQQGEFQKLQSVIVDGGHRFGVSAVAFDQNEFQGRIPDSDLRFVPCSVLCSENGRELIWMGNNGGHVTSYYGNSLEKYTSFQVHATQEIRQILTTPDIVLILSPGQLKGQIRRGLSVFCHSSENMREMQCMLQTSSTSLLMGGHSGELIDFDLPTSLEKRTIHTNSGCAILRNILGRYICCGEPSGQIKLLDPKTLNKEHTIEAHSGSLSDFDVHGNMMVTCGFSSIRGNQCVDRFVKVYDIRNLRAMAPIQVSVDPFLLRFIPSFSARVATVSPSGQMELLETQAVSQTNISLYQVTSNASMCLSFDVSTSCHQMVFGDSNGNLHLFSSNPSANFNSFSRDTEFPDAIEPLPPMNFNDELASFASIPMPLTGQPLLSDWPPEYYVPVFRTICPIDPNILETVKMVGTIGYAPNPNPGTFRRNHSRYRTYEASSPNLITNNNTMPGMSPPSPINHKNLNPYSPPSPQNNHNNGIGGSISPNSMNKSFSRQSSPSHHHQHPGPHHSHLPPGPPPQFFYQQPPAMGPNGPPRPYFHNKPGPPFMKNHFYQGRRPPPHFSRYQIPKKYCKYEWKKNSFEESDMEPFNRTQYAGLEATQANAYCNSVIQILYFIEYLRIGLLSHLCAKEACLSCELGFLFHMMNNSRSSIPCVASNFLRAFRLVPEASALALILQENQGKQRGTYLRLIQSFNRFILHQIQSETEKPTDPSATSYKDPISNLFEMKQDNVNRCVRCGREEKKESIVYLSNLLYSPESTNGGKRCRFIDLLQRSLFPEHTTPAWCESCGKYQPTFQSRVPKALPHLISLNTCLDNAHDFQTWRNHMESSLPEKSMKPDSELFRPPVTPPGPPPHVKSCRYGKSCMRPDCKFYHPVQHEARGPNKVEYGKLTEFEVNPEAQVKWLPLNIRLFIEDNKRVRCIELDQPTELPLDEEAVRAGTAADFELISVVCFVRDPDAEEKCNLVSLIRVPPGEHQGEQSSPTNGTNGNWLLFNDFCVREASSTEAISFNPKWKIPCVVYYQKKEKYLPEHVKVLPQVHSTITEEVFKMGNTLNGRKNRKALYKPLEPEEIPKAGELVAMDAEFVTLGQEETELRSDGKLATVKPQMVTVARVTCVRAQGPEEGTPFLDDYISTQESQVVDYLTKFSGINPGDLDANFSSKNLAILKTVYLKLRYLIDTGVKFVGHGLNNDFRVINLVVPPEQILDTVNLFFLPNQRLISLRFLAWHFLGILIQSEVHDSIEDARTALQLYRKYEELQRTGELEKAIENLYEVGKRIQWKVPVNHASESKGFSSNT